MIVSTSRGRFFCCAWTAVLALGMFVSPSVLGETIQLAPAKDNTLYETTDGLKSNGVGELLLAGRNSQTSLSRRRPVIAFDVAGSIPPGSTIQSAELVISILQNSSGLLSFDLHRLTSDWGEGASDAGIPGGQGAPSAPGDATWLHRFYDTSTWVSGGGDFDLSPTGVAQINGTGELTWSSSASIVQDVQDWLVNPSANFGWIVVGDESAAGTAVRMASRHYSDTSFRPELIVTYEPPPDAIPALSTWGLVILTLSIAALSKACGLSRRTRGRRGLST